MAGRPVDAPHWIATAYGLAMTGGAGRPLQMKSVIARPQAAAIQGGGARAVNVKDTSVQTSRIPA